MKQFLIAVAIATLVFVVAGCGGAKQTPSTSQQTPAPQTAAPAEVGEPTVVAEGKTPEDHVNEYFNLYKDQKLEEAFKLQPAENKAKQPLDQFVPLRKGMPISSFAVSPTQEQGNQKIIAVEYDIGQYGVWVSTWTFEKQGDKWIALRYVAQSKQ